MISENSSESTVTRRELLKKGATLAVSLPAFGALAKARSSSPLAMLAGSGLSGMPRRGGDLKVGMTGGDSSDTLDANDGEDYPDYTRLAQLYNSLVTMGLDALPQYELAEEVSSDKTATVWTIRLRPGVAFHNGKNLGAEDIIFTLRRILNPKSPLPGATPLGPVDPSSLKALDNRTVQLSMETPYASFVEQLASYFYYLYIVPVGYDPKRPIGTGPFVYKSFTPGQQSYFTRNPNYWKTGLPYIDSVTILDFADAASQVNALISSQIDAAGNIEGTQAKTLQSSSGLRVLTSKTGAMTPFTMRVDRPPFNDVRVRQAFRLIVNRPQLIDDALDGYGVVGNDVSSPFDPAYTHSLHVSQDLPKARHLLKLAGQENLSVTLVTSPIALGTVEGATVFAQQAKAAGVNVRVKQVTTTTFFGPDYLSWTFSQDWWYYSPYLAQVAQELLPKSPYNETHWDDPQYVALYNEANRTLDLSKRYEIEHEMQRIDFDSGGLIIASYNDVNDAYSDKLHGFKPARTGIPLMNYGFDQVWFT